MRTPISGHALAAVARPAHAVSQTLSVTQVTPLLAEAVHWWQAAGVDTSILGSIPIHSANLGGRTPGLADAAHHTIWLDSNAAGWGWFVDPMPWDDSEFTTPGNQGNNIAWTCWRCSPTKWATCLARGTQRAA
jgi:hypothetical protein